MSTDFEQRMTEDRAWKMLCHRLQRAPHEAEESDTCSLRAAWKAMLEFSKIESSHRQAYENDNNLLEALQEMVRLARSCFDISDLSEEGQGIKLAERAIAKALQS